MTHKWCFTALLSYNFIHLRSLKIHQTNIGIDSWAMLDIFPGPFRSVPNAPSERSPWPLRPVAALHQRIPTSTCATLFRWEQKNKQKNEKIYVSFGEKHTHTSSLSKNTNHCKKCRDGNSSCLSSTHLLPSMLQLLFWSCHGTMWCSQIWQTFLKWRLRRNWIPNPFQHHQHHAGDVRSWSNVSRYIVSIIPLGKSPHCCWRFTATSHHFALVKSQHFGG